VTNAPHMVGPMSHGKIEIVCDAPVHDGEIVVVHRIRWSSSTADGYWEYLSTPTVDMAGGPFARTAFHCRCGDRLEIRSEKWQSADVVRQLVRNGVSQISLTALRAILF
jgi:hypothetical protein